MYITYDNIFVLFENFLQDGATCESAISTRMIYLYVSEMKEFKTRLCDLLKDLLALFMTYW